MITLNFSVDDQLLTRTDENTVAANSHLVHTCEFAFSSEWDGRGKVATFKKRDLMLSVILDDDACTIPPEILQSENKIDVFELSVCGADGNSTITSTVVKVPILAGTWDVFSEEITPTMFEQIMAKIEELEEDELTIEDVNNAIEEYFEEHPDAVINKSEVFNAIVNSGLINLNIKYTYYKDHNEKTDAAAGVNYYVIAPGHIGGYDSNDYGTVMVNINEGGALAESIYEFYTSGNNLPEGKYQLRNAWSIGTPGVSVIFAYVNEGVEHVLATVDSEHEAAYFEITEEIAEYSQKLYIKVNPGAEYGGQINPLLTYGYVTDFSNIPGCYVATNTELTREVNNLKDSTMNLQGRVLNIETGKQDKIQYAVMPDASADLLGKIYQYTGTTNANYTQGHWYKCVENSGVYSWESTGEDGNIPNITATATVDNTTGTPAVNVSKTGTDAAPEFTFAFTGLKGAKGDRGEDGTIVTKYVAANGNDANDGSEANPLATVDKALELGADVVMVASGRYFQQIDLSKALNSRISIINMSDNNRVIFTDGNRKLSTSEQLTEGYTKVYQFPCNISFPADNKWIFQENVGAPNTLIDNSERLPQQRGLEYRCEDTKIIKCTSNTLNDALNEIENTGNDEFKWYIDNGILYYNRPYAVNAEHPISYSSGKTLFLNNNKNVSIELVGITCKFIGINITDMIAPKLVDCQVMNFYGAGGIEYSRSLGVELIRCETAYVFSGSVGDGINAHGKTGGSKLAKTTTAIITGCWSHDNNDDGFSDHECCESVIVGGLFEHNGKAGITPSYGAHCTCDGVISRNNYNGFYYVGEVTQAEGGKYGQLLCLNCLSESNTNGVGNPNAGYLVAGNGNKMDLINCKSVNNTYGYYPSSGTSMRVIDCTSSDSHIRTGSGTISIINAAKVE